MLGKFFECEVDKNNKFYKIIQVNNNNFRYNKTFPFNEVVVSDKIINLNAIEISDIGGFFISTYEYIFRWLIRGDILCEVEIPENSKVYKTISENGAYVTEKIILTNPKKIDDNFAMKLYMSSTLSDKSYFNAMTACAISGYINTAIKVCKDKVNKENVDIAISEFEGFCQRKSKEGFINSGLDNKNVKILYDKLISKKRGSE